MESSIKIPGEMKTRRNKNKKKQKQEEMKAWKMKTKKWKHEEIKNSKCSPKNNQEIFEHEVKKI